MTVCEVPPEHPLAKTTRVGPPGLVNNGQIGRDGIVLYMEVSIVQKSNINHHISKGRDQVSFKVRCSLFGMSLSEFPLTMVT